MVKISTTDILNLQQKGLDYLYHLEPTQNNLFYVGDFQCNDTIGMPSEKLENSQFRVQSVNFDGMSLESEIHSQSKLNIITGVTRPETVSITWIEDAKRSVQKYHMDWFSKWYNRDGDFFVKGKNGKLRSCTITLFHYINGNLNLESNTETDGSLVPSFDENAFTQAPNVEPLAIIQLKGLIPASIGQHEFSMGESGASGTLSMNYKFTEIEIEYSDSIGSFYI